MNRSYTKIRKIQEANVLLEQRRFLTEAVSKYDKAKPNENQWYTSEDPKSVKTPKGWRIFVKQFGKNPIEPSTLKEFESFKNYFIEYPTQQEVDTKFNEFYTKLVAMQTNPSSVTTTTTTLKPGQTPQTPKSADSSEITQDDLINSIADNIRTQGIGK